MSTGGGNIVLTANGTAGASGGSDGKQGIGGCGGNLTCSGIYLETTGNITAVSNLTIGSGGEASDADAEDDLDTTFGGNGKSITSTNPFTVTAGTSSIVDLTNHVTAGKGGGAGGDSSSVAGNGGDANASLEYTMSVSSLSLHVQATGGDGGYAPNGTSGNGGNATAIAEATNSTGSGASADALAIPGGGGTAYALASATANSNTFMLEQTTTNGSDASVSVTVTSNITSDTTLTELDVGSNLTQSGGNLTVTNTTVINHNGTFSQIGGTASLANISGNGTITIGSGASLTATQISMANGTINANGTLTLSTTGATRQSVDVVADIGNLTLGTSGLLDIKNHDLIIRSASNLTISQVKSLINSAYDSGAWDGTTGITSSSLASNEAIGYATAGELSVTSFDGVSVGSSDIIVKYTYLGDANLDGTVSLTDDAAVWNNFGSGTDWAHGYFSYGTGVTGLSDNADVWNNFGAGGGSPLISLPAPEPASLGVVGFGAVALLRRRKR